MENNKNKFLLADISFPLLVGMACAAIFAGLICMLFME